MSKKKNADESALGKELLTALPVAIGAAMKAGELIRRKFGKFRSLTIKSDDSLVTEVDRASEKIVVGALRGKFKHHTIIGEESGAAVQLGSSFRWHIDPLDGTTNFVHGFPMFCVSIGLEFENLGPVLGVIYHPITNELYTAARGGGAYRNKKRIHSSPTPKLSQALLSTGFSMDKDIHFDQEIATFGRMSRDSYAIRRTGSAALDLTYVATGQFDGFWERGLHTWDVTAALCLIAEAGGAFSQMDGKPYRVGDETVLATNGKIHKEIVRLLNGRA